MEATGSATAAVGGRYLPAVRAAVAHVLGTAHAPGPGERLHDDLGFDSVMFMLLRDELSRRVPEAAGTALLRLTDTRLTVAAVARALEDVPGTDAAW